MLAAIAALPLTAAAQAVWRLSNWVPPTHQVSTDILAAWGKAVGEATQGRVSVQIIPALGPPPAHFDLVKNGVADVALIGPTYTPGRFTLLRVAEMPFLSETSTASSIALATAQEKLFAPANEFDGVKLAGIWTHGPAHIFTVGKPVTALGDFRGLKIRTAGGLSDEVARLAGATPFFAPANQVYDVLSKGVADGVLFPAESVPGFRIESIVKQATLVPGGIYQLPHALIVNKAKWDALSPADRAAVDRLNGMALTRMASAVWDRINDEGIATMRKVGVQFRTADAAMLADMRGRYAGLLEAWYADAAKKNVDGPAAWKLISETVRASGKS